MVFRRSTLLAVFSLSLALAGCESVPDYLVEGRLPHFGKQPDEVARNEAPPAPEAAPAPASAAKPDEVAPKSKWHLWPQKHDSEAAPDVAEAPSPPPAAAPAAPVTVEAAPPAEAAPDAAPAGKKSLWPVFGGNKAPPLAGGFSKASGADVDAAVAYAMHESPLYELKGVKSAAMQVVAGRNYALCLKVRQIDHEANPFHIRLVLAQVFEGLDGHYELTSWQEVNSCG